jgi:hypothetical protein
MHIYAVKKIKKRDPSRTMDPSEADIFFVPAYLQISYDMSKSAGSGRTVHKPAHDDRLAEWVKALKVHE